MPTDRCKEWKKILPCFLYGVFTKIGDPVMRVLRNSGMERSIPVRRKLETANLESGLFTSAAAGLDVFYAVRVRCDIPEDDLKQRER